MKQGPAGTGRRPRLREGAEVTLGWVDWEVLEGLRKMVLGTGPSICLGPQLGIQMVLNGAPSSEAGVRAEGPGGRRPLSLFLLGHRPGYVHQPRGVQAHC